MASVSVAIVDDDDDIRSLVHLLFDLDGAIDVVGEADSSAAGIALWRAHRPDVLVLDYRMPDRSGLDVAREILGEDPTAVIVMFSAWMTDDDILEAERIGCRAVVSKDQLRALTDLVIAFGRLE